MAFEESLIQYGALGVMVAYLMWKDKRFEDKTSQVIQNNTIALTRFSEKSDRCPMIIKEKE